MNDRIISVADLSHRDVAHGVIHCHFLHFMNEGCYGLYVFVPRVCFPQMQFPVLSGR